MRWPIVVPAFRREIRSVYRRRWRGTRSPSSTALRVVRAALNTTQDPPAAGTFATFLQMFGLSQSVNPELFDLENRLWPRPSDPNYSAAADAVFGLGETRALAGSLCHACLRNVRETPRMSSATISSSCRRSSRSRSVTRVSSRRAIPPTPRSTSRPTTISSRRSIRRQRLSAARSASPPEADASADETGRRHARQRRRCARDRTAWWSTDARSCAKSTIASTTISARLRLHARPDTLFNRRAAHGRACGTKKIRARSSPLPRHSADWLLSCR